MGSVLLALRIEYHTHAEITRIKRVFCILLDKGGKMTGIIHCDSSLCKPYQISKAPGGRLGYLAEILALRLVFLDISMVSGHYPADMVFVWCLLWCSTAHYTTTFCVVSILLVGLRAHPV